MTIPVQFVQTYLKVGVLQAFSQRGVWVSLGHPIADFGHPKYPYFLCIMQWDEKELDTQFTPHVYVLDTQ